MGTRDREQDTLALAGETTLVLEGSGEQNTVESNRYMALHSVSDPTPTRTSDTTNAVQGSWGHITDVLNRDSL